jgi:hypothetical protein
VSAVPSVIDPNAFASPPTAVDPVATTWVASTEEIEAIAIAKKPPPRSSASPVLLVVLSLAAFVLVGRGAQTVQQLALLVAVLFFHEAGHIAGMRFFGYRDLKMLFVPFMGALASGTKSDAPGWQRAIVLLLGPMPGLWLSVLLLAVSPTGITRALAVQLIVINALNLFPLVPLDGGLFVQQLFAAHPRIQAAWSAIGLLAFGGLCLYGRAWLLAAVAYFFLALIPVQLKIAISAATLRKAWGRVPPIGELSDEAAHDLYERARDQARTASPKPQFIASMMRQIRERAASEPIAAFPALVLVGAYLSGFTLIIIDLWLLRTVR